MLNLDDFEISHSPRKHGLPHDIWRNEQLEAFQKCVSILRDGEENHNIVIEAPVGIGKSGIATALGSMDYVTAVVSNHGLISQYASKYGFKPIYGRQEYKCVLDEKVNEWKQKYNLTPTAGDCHFEKMNECPAAVICPYIEAKNAAIASRRMVCTYKYAALSDAVQDRPGILVMDEAHNAAEDLLDVAAFELTESERNEYRFDPFPLQEYGSSGKGDLIKDERFELIAWISKQIHKIAVVDLFDMISPTASKNTKMVNRLKDAMAILSSNSDIFYYCSMDKQEDWRVFRKHKPQMTMKIKTLDVSHVIRKICGNKKNIILMSATIGRPHPLMHALGFNTWEFMSFPHPTPVDKRPVFDLGLDKMTKKNLDDNPGMYKNQADVISKFIKGYDPSWRAIVLTSSNYKVNTLRRMLAGLFPNRVLFPDDGQGLLDRISGFIDDPRKGLIAVDTIQGWGSGISLDGELARIVVVAGVPFMNPGDRFESIRMSTETGKRYGWWKPFSDVAQATGRVTRGEREQNGDYMLNVAAIADGSALTPQAKAMYPVWMKSAIRK